MATKNGLCTYCQFTRIENHIFPVNPEASTVYCPFCMRELNPKDAIGLYQSIIVKMVNKADNSLFVACDPVLAYQQYADVLEIEPDNSKALLGRILCLIYTSKVRQAYLNECNELLESITHKGTEEVNTFVGFLKKINFALDEYDMALFAKLTHKKYFYDEECIKLYLKRLADIIKFKKDILAELTQIKKDYVTQNNEILMNLISHSINENEASLRSVKYTVQGVGYKYTKIVGDKIYVERIDEVISTKISKHKPYTLSPTKKKKLIDDKVFKDYTSLIRAKNVAIYFSLFLLLATVGLGITAYFFFEKGLLFYVFIGAGALSFVGFIVLLILYLSWKSILKKRKMRIS